MLRRCLAFHRGEWDRDDSVAMLALEFEPFLTYPGKELPTLAASLEATIGRMCNRRGIAYQHNQITLTSDETENDSYYLILRRSVKRFN